MFQRHEKLGLGGLIITLAWLISVLACFMR